METGPPVLGRGGGSQVILSESELARLIAVCGSDLRDIVVAGIWTGARLGELISARGQDFDGRMLRVDGKTGPREIYVPREAAELLSALARGRHRNDRLFVTSRGRAWNRNLVAVHFKSAVTEAELDVDTSFYSLRHSFISRALVAGVPTKALADHCGTSEAMISKFYAKFLASDREIFATMAAPRLQIAEMVAPT